MELNTGPHLQPAVLHPVELVPFIQYLLANHAAPSNLIVCSSREAFLSQLQASVHHSKDLDRAEAEEAGLPPEAVARVASRDHELLVPTIHQLSSSRTIKVTFCATLAQLQAYLGVYGRTQFFIPSDERKDDPAGAVPTIALLNPLAIHKETSSFSAQGLSRTFASAVEAATRSNQKLVIVECPSRVHRILEDADADDDEDEDEDMAHDEGRLRRLNDGVDPWNQQLPILNVTTKSFGAGERGWVGRTVLARRIAARWCVFEAFE
jgi:hypothetical protein